MFDKLKAWLKPPQIDWLQVEVTSYCNAQCIYCPRTVYRDKWLNRHLELDVFKKVAPLLPYTKLVYLQGWGEPFLSASLFEMIKISKSHGAVVGLTSNATLIDQRVVSKLIEAELDIIALSIVGDKTSHDHIRQNTSYEQVLSVIHEINTQKNLQHKSKPAINIAYLVIDKDLRAVYEFIDSCEVSAVSYIILNRLDYVASNELLNYAVNFTPQEDKEAITNLKAYAKQKGISIISNLTLKDSPLSVCSENVRKTLYMSADGSISPCVYLNLPIRDFATYYTPKPMTYQRHLMGNVSDKSLQEIWQAKQYACFRESFLKGNYLEFCSHCPKLYVVDS